MALSVQFVCKSSAVYGKLLHGGVGATGNFGAAHAADAEWFLRSTPSAEQRNGEDGGDEGGDAEGGGGEGGSGRPVDLPFRDYFIQCSWLQRAPNLAVAT